MSQVSETSTHYLHTHNRTLKCANVFREILLSEKFALLCDLLQGNFHDVKLNGVFDLSMINSRMGSGYYEQFPEFFDQDIQLVFFVVIKIVLSATSTFRFHVSIQYLCKLSFAGSFCRLTTFYACPC